MTFRSIVLNGSGYNVLVIGSTDLKILNNTAFYS